MKVFHPIADTSTTAASDTGVIRSSDATRATIVDARIDAVAAMLRQSPAGALDMLSWDDPAFWNVEGSYDDRCQFLAIGNAINFRFWCLDREQIRPASGWVEGEEYRGSLYMWRRLRVAVVRGELDLDARSLARLDILRLEAAFTDDRGDLPLRPALAERLANLRDLGRGLHDRWGGRFGNLVSASGGSLASFESAMSEFRAFDDPVQKLTMVTAIMLAGSGLTRFDRDPLPAIDYHLVKQAVRQGLIEPSQLLGEKLRKRALLDEDESLDLRRATLTALSRVAAESGLSTARLDNLYWLNRRVCEDDVPACTWSDGPTCPFAQACAQRTEFGLPLELTRYY